MKIWVLYYCYFKLVYVFICFLTLSLSFSLVPLSSLNYLIYSQSQYTYIETNCPTKTARLRPWKSKQLTAIALPVHQQESAYDFCVCLYQLFISNASPKNALHLERLAITGRGLGQDPGRMGEEEGPRTLQIHQVST